MNSDLQFLVKRGDKLFSDREPALTLWQELAENFYVERADFTTSRDIGDEFASHLMTSLPLMIRRDLANQISAMLRPRGKDWFEVAPSDERLAEDQRIKLWCQDKSAVMRRAVYDIHSGFVRSTKTADHDFVTFGQAVLTVELDRMKQSLLYRDWHLRDVAWAENYARHINEIHHRLKLPARDVLKLFPKTCHEAVRKAAGKEPLKDINLRRIIVPTEKEGRYNYCSYYVDVDNEHELEKVDLIDHPYVIPRWTLVGSQYAHSPATVVALPEARTLQAMTLTLFEAGEKAVNPPLVATQEAVRSDVNVYAGGVTWVDAEYDEKLGDALRPLTTDRGGLAFGMDMIARMSDLLKEAFYLNKIMLPPVGDAMTATEVRIRTEEYVRAALPLFEPLETDYNGALCEKTWNILMREGAFGNLREEMPKELQGQDISFSFQTPLQSAQEREKAASFQELIQLLAAGIQVDQKLVMEVDTRRAFRDAANGIIPDADWIVPEDLSAQALEGAQQAQQLQELAGATTQGLDIAKAVGETASAFQQTGVV
jgi:hypothetical protein